MGWFDIVGGASRGYVQGQEDEQRRQEFLALQNQRKRLEKQQKEDDALSETYKAVRPAGDYDEVTYGAGTSDPTQLGAGAAAPARSTTKKVKRTAADVAREQAGVLETGGGLRHIQTAAALRQQAYQTEAADRANRLAQKQEVLTTAGQLKAVGNKLAAARALQEGYSKYVPDGHELQIEQGSDGTLYWGITGPDGTWVEPPEKITDESLDKRINQGMAMLSPELNFKSQELGLKKEEVGIHRITANAAAKNAETALMKANYEIEKLGPAQIKLMEDQGYAARTRAEADRAAAQMGRFGQVIQGTDSTGKAMYVAIDQRTGTPIKIDFGDFTPAKLPQQLTDAAKVAMTAEIADHKAKVDAGKFASSAAADAALQDIVKKYDTTQGSTIYDKANAANPRLRQGQGAPYAAPMGISPMAAQFAGYSSQQTAPAPVTAPALAAASTGPTRAPGQRFAHVRKTDSINAVRAADAEENAQYEEDRKTMTPLQLAQKYYPETAATAARLGNR